MKAKPVHDQKEIHKEEQKEYFKEWLLKNPEYMKKYNVENRETLNKKRREFYSIEENRERKIKRNHRWYVKNKDHINKNTKVSLFQIFNRKSPKKIEKK